MIDGRKRRTQHHHVIVNVGTFTSIDQRRCCGRDCAPSVQSSSMADVAIVVAMVPFVVMIILTCCRRWSINLDYCPCARHHRRRRRRRRLEVTRRVKSNAGYDCV